MSNGFTKLRHGLEDYLLREEISFFDAHVFTTILKQADYATGVWFGSAQRLLATAPLDNTLDKSRNSLRRLVSLRFLKPFPDAHSHRTSVYLIHKFEATCGQHSGLWTNAWATTDWKSPVWESAQDVSASRASREQGAQETPRKQATSQDLDVDLDVKEMNEGKREAAPSTSGSDSGSEPKTLELSTEGERIAEKGDHKTAERQKKAAQAEPKPKASPEAVALCDYLRAAVKLKTYSAAIWYPLAEKLLADCNPEELRAVIDFAMGNPFWTDKVTDMKSFHRWMTDERQTLMKKYLAALRKKEVEAKKQEEDSKPKRKEVESEWE